MKPYIKRLKIKGKWYVQARSRGSDSKVLLSRRRWYGTGKNKFTLSDAVKKFNKDKTLSKRRRLNTFSKFANYREITQIKTNGRLSLPKKEVRSLLYYSTVKVKDVIATARAKTQDKAEFLAIARACGNLKSTREDLAIEIIESNDFEVIEEGVVYYEEI